MLQVIGRWVNIYYRRSNTEIDRQIDRHRKCSLHGCMVSKNDTEHSGDSLQQTFRKHRQVSAVGLFILRKGAVDIVDVGSLWQLLKSNFVAQLPFFFFFCRFCQNLTDVISHSNNRPASFLRLLCNWQGREKKVPFSRCINPHTDFTSLQHRDEWGSEI